MKTEKSSFSFKYALLAMLMFFSVGVMAQTTVTGTVLDDLGEGAVGAVVLTVSYVGFQSQEVALNGCNKAATSNDAEYTLKSIYDNAK